MNHARLGGGSIWPPALLTLGFCLESLTVATAFAAAAPSKVDFNRDVRPILAENCFACHGPDEDKRKAKLRLDVRDVALKPAKSGAVPIVPGSAEPGRGRADAAAQDRQAPE